MYGTCYHFILAKYTIFILAILLINILATYGTCYIIILAKYICAYLRYFTCFASVFCAFMNAYRKYVSQVWCHSEFSFASMF